MPLLDQEARYQTLTVEMFSPPVPQSYYTSSTPKVHHKHVLSLVYLEARYRTLTAEMSSPLLLPLPRLHHPFPPQHHLHPEVFPPHRLPLKKKSVKNVIFAKQSFFGTCCWLEIWKTDVEHQVGRLCNEYRSHWCFGGNLASFKI